MNFVGSNALVLPALIIIFLFAWALAANPNEDFKRPHYCSTYWVWASATGERIAGMETHCHMPMGWK